jgi:hypothetical protein
MHPACPGDAVGADGWSVPLRARARPDDRTPPAAMPAGVRPRPEHRYPVDALAYHQRRARDPLLRFSGR